MKIKCLHCGYVFTITGMSFDELGWHTSCPECEGSFDVDVEEILKISKTPTAKRKWKCTDDDSSQYIRKNEEFPNTYDLIEMSLFDPDEDKYEVYIDTICIDDYLEDEDTKEELTFIVNHFDYHSIDDVKLCCGEAAFQVMAECIFEHYGSFQANQIFMGSENECREFIKNYISK